MTRTRPLGVMLRMKEAMARVVVVLVVEGVVEQEELVP
jgi:hypothetical protein